MDLDPDGGGSRVPRRPLADACMLIGIALFCYLASEMGIAAIAAQMSRFGWRFAVICLLGASWLLFQTLAWRAVQRERFRGVALGYLFGVKLVSDALNTLLPSANLGGEAARLHLTRGFLSREEGLAGIVVDKTLEYGAAIPFMILGFAVAWAGGFFPGPLLLPAVLCLIISLAGMLAFTGFQLKGLHPLRTALSRSLPWLRRRIAGMERQIRGLGARLARLYRVPRARILTAWGLHFLARLAGVLETMLIMSALGWPVDFGRALFITAMAAGINTVFFLMPGQWGVAEGSQLFILQCMGYPPLAGLSLGVIKRIRKLAFAAVGMLVYFWHRGARSSAPCVRRSHG